MKLDFEGYTYFNPNENINDFNKTDLNNKAYNENYFNSLIDNHDYQGAADYLKKFHFTGENAVKKNYELNAQIDDLEYQAMDYNAKWSRTPTENKSAVEFSNVAMDVLAVDRLAKSGIDENGNYNGNPYAKKFIELKKQFADGGDIVEYEFKPQKQTFMGIDWLVKDNDDANINSFLDSLGYSEDQLRNNNIDVTHKGDKTYIKFDKTNPLSNLLIAHYPYDSYYRPAVRGYTRDGKPSSNTPLPDTNDLSKAAYAYINDIAKYPNNYNYSKRESYFDEFRGIWNLLEDANNQKNTWYESSANRDGVFSSTVGDYIDDNLHNLQTLRNTGAIDEKEFREQYKFYMPKVLKLVQSIRGHELYSNAYNDDPKNEVLNAMTSDKQKVLEDMLINSDPADLILQSMTSNGKYGVLITIPGKNKTKDYNYEDTPEDIVKQKPIQIFIPGLLSDKIKERMNRDPKLFAIKTSNEMQKEGLNYRTRTGDIIKSTGPGEFVINDDDTNPIYLEDVQRIINKDRIIRNAIRELKYEFLTIDDKLVDKDNFEELTRRLAVKAGNELYDEPLMLTDGTQLTLDMIFNNRTAGGGFAQLGMLRDAQNSRVTEKVMTIYDIYDQIINDMYKYLMAQ